MRKLVVTENITLDGVIDASGGWFSPGDTDPDVDLSDALEALREQWEASDAFLVGRVTFEQLRGYWPLQTDDTTGIADYLDKVAKYVVSRTLDDPGWQNTTILDGALTDDIERLKSQPGKDIVATGSISLVRALIDAGLVDEFRLFVYPVVLGKGRQLFAGTTGVDALRLAEARPFRSGVVLLTYQPR